MLKPRKKISEKTIERLSIYRRYLKSFRKKDKSRVYSHELAQIVSGTGAQVRRDLMAVGCSGCSSKGYEVDALIEEIGHLLDCSEKEKVALVGVGNLGRAILGFFSGKRENFEIVASFDSDPEKCDRVICGRRCYSMNKLEEKVKSEKIHTAILAVPVEKAQTVADQLFQAGIRAVLNFAPTHIASKKNVFVHNIDMTLALEKVIFFSRQNFNSKEG
ncbi:MAG: redox-sensing transcriptional repressor Rex [Candidatus Rifleibacteriota bacterium]